MAKSVDCSSLVSRQTTGGSQAAGSPRACSSAADSAGSKKCAVPRARLRLAATATRAREGCLRSVFTHDTRAPTRTPR